MAKAETVPKTNGTASKTKKKCKTSIGLLRLDYVYRAHKGFLIDRRTFNFPVNMTKIKDLTFDEAKQGVEVDPSVFKNAISTLMNKNDGNEVIGIVADCGFFMSYEKEVRDLARVPVYMSSLLQSSLAQAAISADEKIAIFTADDRAWTDGGDGEESTKERFLMDCGIKVENVGQFLVKGCQDVKGFNLDVVKNVKITEVRPRIVNHVKKFITQQKKLGNKIGAIVFECTELPPFSNAVRKEVNLPVYDIVTAANALHATLTGK